MVVAQEWDEVWIRLSALLFSVRTVSLEIDILYIPICIFTIFAVWGACDHAYHVLEKNAVVSSHTRCLSEACFWVSTFTPVVLRRWRRM